MPQTIPNLHWENNTPYLGLAPQDNFYEEEARQQAEGLRYLTRLISWGRTSVVVLARNKMAAARAINPFPGIDFALGAIEQAMDDERKPERFTLRQRLLRPLAVGGESFVTGLVSDELLAIGGAVGGTAGEGIMPEGGGIPGAVTIGGLSYLGASLIGDEIVWPAINQRYLSFLGEWK